MNDIAIFVPAEKMDCMTPVVQLIDGPNVTAAMWFSLRCSADALEPPAYFAARFSAATDEQKQVLVENACEGVWIVNLGELTFDEASLQLGMTLIVLEEM